MRNLSAYTTLLEKIFLIGLMAGGVFAILRIEPIDAAVTVVALFGLGLVYFLCAYRPIDMPQEEGKAHGMKELLVFGIVPKVLWISSAVSVIAIALTVLGSDNRGYLQMFFIGAASIAVALVIVLIVSVGQVIRSSRSLAPVLFRAIPLLAVDLYFLLR